MRLLYLWMFLRFKSFNPRICKRCDMDERLSGYRLYRFNPRICKRCDSNCCCAFFLSSVSIHASVKDATLYVFFRKLAKISFNPRICKRCDVTKSITAGVNFTVSIHASVKDATNLSINESARALFQSTHL